MTGTVLAIRDADVMGVGPADVVVADGHIVAITPAGSREPRSADVDAAELDAGGGGLLHGLHDHHVHVLSAAAALTSVPCGRPEIRDAHELRDRLRAAVPVSGWVRGVNYDDGVAGPLDRRRLDALAGSAPTRVQHRSGALWTVNSAGCDVLGLDGAVGVEGIERDAGGRPTGRLWRLDAWLRDRLDGGEASITAGVEALSAQLVARGITGVTDATPDLDAGAVRVIVDAGFAPALTTMGERHDVPGVQLGPRKIVIGDHDLPAPDSLTQRIAAARPRAVALHCVTREALVLALLAIEGAGPLAGDRIEHAAVCAPDLALWISRLGLRVVTQPSMVALRGDDYLDRVDADDLPHLWPFASLLDAAVAVGCSSDLPYGDLDPWRSLVAARNRLSPAGRPVAPVERVPASTALAGYLGGPGDPGGPARLPRVGGRADLCLLDRPLRAALDDPARVEVRTTLVAGRVVHEAGEVRQA